ncbi:MAG: HAMP domain-containing sensor histidine kinase [Archaeoglobaceae archaeon]
MLDRYMVIIMIFTLTPLLIPFLFPEFVQFFILTYAFLYLLSLATISLFLALFLIIAWKGERRLFMITLTSILSLLVSGLLFSFLNLKTVGEDFEKIYLTFLEFSTISPISLALFIGLYFPVLSFGIWKLGKEFAFIELKDLMLAVSISLILGFITAYTIQTSTHISEIKDMLSVSLLLDLLILFVYTLLIRLYWETESRAYYSIILAFIAFWILGDLTTITGIFTYGLPTVFYTFALVSILYGLVNVYRRDVAILDYTEVVEEKERISELYKTTKELQEILSIINRMLRHDVKNKLQIILGYIEVFFLERKEEHLEKAMKAVEEVNEYLDKIRALERALYAGIELLKPIDVRKIVEEILNFYEIPYKIYGSCFALADESLYSVIDNIVNNAIKHGKTEKIDVYLSEIEEQCEIRIVDYGVGIPQEIKRRVFEEGFTVDNKTGTGIGLYVVKKVVERYGGRVWVEDTKPRGATFVIRLRAPSKK